MNLTKLQRSIDNFLTSAPETTSFSEDKNFTFVEAHEVKGKRVEIYVTHFYGKSPKNAIYGLCLIDIEADGSYTVVDEIAEPTKKDALRGCKNHLKSPIGQKAS